MRVGIDLGTTYCAIAYINPSNGKAEIIKNKEGKPITPSVLYFDDDGTILHGEDAKIYLEEGSDKTANYFKYYMGDSAYSIYRNGKEYTAIDLSAELLKGVVREAEDVMGENIYDAVITVPAYFDHFMRQATMEAGKKAGLNVLNIISEPTAAVFAYGIHGKGTNQTVLVYDLGGGTFDVTIARITDDEITVLGTDGNHRLGGKDWDDALAGYLSDQFEEEFDIDLNDDPEMATFLQALAENTKKQLTSKQSQKVTINYQGHKGVYEVTQELFDDITSYNLNITKDVIEKLLSELKMSWKQIDGVLLVGGSTRMQQVKKYLTEMCGRPPMSGVNVDEAVAIGAAIRANIDANGKIQEAVRLSLGGSRMLLGASASPVLSIAGAKRIKDATAHSMGMIAVNKEVTKYVNSIMIRKNSEIPATVTSPYELGVVKNADNRLEVYMLQGEEEHLTYPLNCTVLGKYVFTGIQVGSEKKEIIDVTYSYDENNIVNVSAVQKSCGKQLMLHIEPVEADMSWVIEDPKARMKAVQPEMAVYFAIDLSGSMAGDRLSEAKRAAISFIKEFDLSYVDVGLINFSDRTVVYQPLCHDERTLVNKINSWAINAGGLGYGNDAEPFSTANRELRNISKDVKYLVVLTDGYWSYENRAIEEAKKLHRLGIEVIAIGFGSAKKSFLKAVASRDDFASLTDLSNLQNTLTGIAKIL